MNASYNFMTSPRSTLRHSSNDLQLQDISHLPIVYPSSRTGSLRQSHSRSQSRSRGDYADKDSRVDEIVDEGDDDGTDWEIEREYIDVGAANAYGGNGTPAGSRPGAIRRDSQDVEFGNRLQSMRSLRTRPWEVNVRLPHIPKQFARGKTRLLQTLRGGLRRVHPHGHTYGSVSRTGSNGSPPFEFRDPQPAPQSIRQQYAELAPTEYPQTQTQTQAATNGDSNNDQTRPAQANSNTSQAVTAEMRAHNGLLAPPAPVNGPIGDADTNRMSRHSRSVSATYRSRSRPNTGQALRPRSRSVASRHSHRSHRSHHSAASEETAVAAQTGSQVHGNPDEDGGETAEATLVQHMNDLTLSPISKKSSKFTLIPHPSQRHSALYPAAAGLRFPRPRWWLRSRHHPHSYHQTRFIRYKKHKASIKRAVEAFQRLPWMAAPEHPPGWLIPEEDPPRITKDFVPARSDRAKLRGTVAPGTGLVYKRKGVSVEELEGNQRYIEDGKEAEMEGGRSWYRPGTKQLQKAARSQQHQRGLGLGGLGLSRPVKQAYASYRAVSTKGRPLDYMYASGAGAGIGSRAASMYSTSTRRYDYAGYPRASEGSARVGVSRYGSDGRPRPGTIAAAASAYLTRSSSAGASHNSHQTSESMMATPPPVPPKSGVAAPQVGYAYSQSRPQQPYGYAYAQPTPTASGTGVERPVQYYGYSLVYPQAQTHPSGQGHSYQGYRAHVRPGSSPSLPPVPTASYSGSTSVPYSRYSQRKPVPVERSVSRSIPTIPTAQSSSAPASSASSYSYTRSHGQGHSHHHRSGYDSSRNHVSSHDYRPHVSRRYAERRGMGSSSDTVTSGYGTVVSGPLQYADYGYVYAR